MEKCIPKCVSITELSHKRQKSNPVMISFELPSYVFMKKYIGKLINENILCILQVDIDDTIKLFRTVRRL